MSSIQRDSNAPSDEGYVDIVNPEARKFVADGTSGFLISQFVDAEVTLARAANYFGMSKQRMSYWINKMLDLRLIKVVRKERADNGSMQAVYSATALKFRIRRSNLTQVEWREMLAIFTNHVWGRVLDSAIHASRRSPGDALRVFRDKQTNVCWRLIGRDEDSGSHDGYFLNWGRVTLTEEKYHEMQRELSDVIKRYQTDSKSGPGQIDVWYVAGANEQPPEPTK